MDKLSRLYLLTLEVVPLEVGKIYNPLPSHLTLISRFYSHNPSEDIANEVNVIFSETKSIKLVFDKSTTIGPKHVEVRLIQASNPLVELHAQISQALNKIRVNYTQPEYIGSGWKPHVSIRDDDNFASGLSIMTNAAYLIEVNKQGDNHLRTIRQRFNLSS